jgi:hypothetical protein
LVEIIAGALVCALVDRAITELNNPTANKPAICFGHFEKTTFMSEHNITERFYCREIFLPRMSGRAARKNY